MNTKKFLLVILTFASLAMGPPATHAALTNEADTFPGKVEAGDEALIAATIQIRVSPSGKQDEFQTGLGTLVASGDESFILTHDHWPATGRSGRVQFLTAQGDLLLELSVKAFQALVVCEDSGSLVLRSPLRKDQPAARIGLAGALKKDDTLRIAYLKGGSGSSVRYLTGRLGEITRHKDIPVFELRLPDGETPGPDEAVGGIWLNGQFVGLAWELKPYARWSVVQLDLPSPGPDEATPPTIDLLLMQPAHLLPSSFQVG